MHDRVRTNLTMVLAVLELQLKHDSGKTNDQILKDLHSLIRSLTIVHESMAQAKQTNYVDLKNYAIKLSNRVQQGLRKEKKDIQIKVNANENVTLDMGRAMPFALIINELVMNACIYAFDPGESGQIVIELYEKNGEVFLKVTDNGKGLPEDFEKKAAKGIGMRIIRAFTKQLNAELEYSSTDVTTFKLKLGL
ncbi:sensor histidine kinase [Gracilimonas sp.]|uniref:sensor histidine kinase n=1 Tax=Gracilimonas sp. TaxID=1974203 RepID=UPI00287240BA|nr:sensor histidine kinase [Gracilimonas sp.]